VFAHAAADTGLACRLCVVEVSTGSTTPLTVADGATPTWSIAGPIAFSTTGSLSGVFVVDPDGTGRRRVSGDLRGATDPRWSPDGRRLIFSTAGPGSSIAVVDPDGGDLTLVEGGGTDRSPAWQPRPP
jgi:Tol biopolymer transport system component